MLLPALLLALAPTLLPATVQASVVHCGPSCSRLSELPDPGVGVGLRSASGYAGAGHVLAAHSDSSVLTGALPSLRAVTGTSQLAGSAPAAAPAQAPQTSAPAPSEQPAADSPAGTGLERWQATIVAVVVAGVIVWLTGRLRRMGRKG